MLVSPDFVISMARTKANPRKFAGRGEEDVFFKDWFIAYVGGFLSFKDLVRWDVAMCSQRKKWLQALSNVQIVGIDVYEHRCNESVRWLISRRIQHVTNITYGEGSKRIIRSKSFAGARVLANLTSITLYHISDSILTSLKVNCPYLEEVSIECESVGESSSFAAAARMVQNLPRLLDFQFTRNKIEAETPSSLHLSSTPILLALALFCPLLESLDLAKYNNEGLAELIAGCPKLHTLTINADMSGVSLAGYRALGQSRSITVLNVNTWAIGDVDAALRAMADEGMPIKTLNLHTSNMEDHFGNDGISVVARFSSTLEHPSIKDFIFANHDEGLQVLSQCHNLRSIEIENREGGEGGIAGSFLMSICAGCPLLEKVTIVGIVAADEESATFVNFTPFFERCPKLKEFNVNIHTDEEVKALAQHCPIVERIKLGSCKLSQEHSEISDVSLVVIAQGLRFLTHIMLNYTQCTDAGLLELAKGEFSLLEQFRIHNGSWKQGFPLQITKEGFKEFNAAIKKCSTKPSIHCCEYYRLFNLYF